MDVKQILLTYLRGSRDGLLWKAEGLSERAQQLEEMAATLLHLADHCSGDDRPDCPIIEELAAPGRGHEHHHHHHHHGLNAPKAG